MLSHCLPLCTCHAVSLSLALLLVSIFLMPPSYNPQPMSVGFSALEERSARRRMVKKHKQAHACWSDDRKSSDDGAPQDCPARWRLADQDYVLTGKTTHLILIDTEVKRQTVKKWSGFVASWLRIRAWLQRLKKPRGEGWRAHFDRKGTIKYLVPWAGPKLSCF